MATTLGLHARQLDLVRALRTKRGRRDQGRYAVEGPTLLAEALISGLAPAAVYATAGAAAASQRLLAPLDDRLFVVPERAMARISDLEAPPGLIAVLPISLESVSAILQLGAPVALLAGIADPGNAGTLLRSAEIFGIDRAVFAVDAVEPHNPKVVRATMGALFRMRVAVAEPQELLQAARAAGYRIVAAARDGRPLPEYRFPERPLLAIGSERHGVAYALPEYDESVAIPHAGGGESLNASVAGGIIFYAFSQQVRAKIDGGQILENP